MRNNIVFAAVGLMLAGTALTACGSGDGGSSDASGDYCSELKADQTFFGALDGSDPDLSKIDELFTRMHTLADDAPDEVAADWRTLDGAFTTIEEALKEAGLKPGDLGDIQNGQVPAGIDASKLQALLPKLQSLSSGEVSQAASRIASNAKAKCGVDLTGS
jgi:hypothetical protein